MADNSQDGGKEKDTKTSWERSVLERVAMAAIIEQRRSRRWGIFFKLFFVLLFLLMLWLTQSDRFGHGSLSARHTALVDLEGVIESNGKASADSVISGLRAAFEAKGTVGVILRANSPGGSPVQSAYINTEITRLREQYPDIPIYAVVGDVCASGCYYSIVAADQIYASPASLVGSIGVVSDSFGFVGTLKKLGVERRLMTAGENKGFLDPFSPLNPKHERFWNGLLQDIHRQFINAVKEGRGDALHETKDMFSGLVWAGDRAKELGLIDEFGSASDVARDVFEAEDIVDYTVQEDLLNRFAGRLGTAMTRSLALESRSVQLR